MPEAAFLQGAGQCQGAGRKQPGVQGRSRKHRGLGAEPGLPCAFQGVVWVVTQSTTVYFYSHLIYLCYLCDFVFYSFYALNNSILGS